MANLAGPPGTSLHQVQLDSLVKVADVADAAIALQDARNAGSGAGTLNQARAAALTDTDRAKLQVPWSMLQTRHPQWDATFWTECRALYAGGKRLLGVKELLERLFPKNGKYEPNDMYEQRKQRAHYFPYPGTIIDSLLAGLFQDPLRVAFGTINEETGEIEEAEGADWWESFVEDVSDEAGGDEPDDDDDDDTTGLSLHQFGVELMREAMQTGFTWVRCELPAALEAPEMIDSALAEEKAKVRDPYLCLVPAEQVIDWQYDNNDTGKNLAWVLTLEKSCPRPSIAQPRGAKEHHKYTLWTQTDYVVYELDVDLKNPPNPATLITPTGGAPHSFGCVPLDRICLPDGLYAMGKLHNLAREHFNKRCAMSWAEYKALFPILYEFLDNGEQGGEIPTVGETRATDQLRAQGWTQQRRKGDAAEFIGPDVAPFKEARESCNDAMREMHRVMFSMALSANMDKQALSRSGDSKEQDQVSTQVVLLALGHLMRRIARVLLALVSAGRGEAVPKMIVSGLEHFDVSGISQTIADAVQVFSGGVPINKSHTAYKLYVYKILRKILGEDATDAQLKAILDELDETITAEELLAQAAPPGAGATDPTDPTGKGDDDDEEGDDGDREPPEREAAPSGTRFKSKPMKR